MMDLGKGITSSQELLCYDIPESFLVLKSNVLVALMVLKIFISITATIGNLRTNKDTGTKLNFLRLFLFLQLRRKP